MVQVIAVFLKKIREVQRVTCHKICFRNTLENLPERSLETSWWETPFIVRSLTYKVHTRCFLEIFLIFSDSVHLPII